jgi:hypothetical protein
MKKKLTCISLKIRGDVSGIVGDASNFVGDIDECELSEEDRKNGVRIEDLIV